MEWPLTEITLVQSSGPQLRGGAPPKGHKLNLGGPEMTKRVEKNKQSLLHTFFYFKSLLVNLIDIFCLQLSQAKRRGALRSYVADDMFF